MKREGEGGRERDCDLKVKNKRNWLTSSNAYQLSGRVIKEEEGLLCSALLGEL